MAREDQVDEGAQQKLSRRTLLRGAVAAAAVPIAAACVGATTTTSTTPPAATSAGATAKATAKLGGDLNILQWSHFVPDYDTYLDKWAADWGAKNGVKVKIDRVPQADLPARAASEAAAKSGHDLFGHWSQGFAALFEDNLVDISDICNAAASKYGGFIPAGEAIGKVNGKWRDYPNFFIPFPSLWRKDAWTTVGLPNGPTKWSDLLDNAAKLKANNTPIGTSYAQNSDAEQTWRSLLWSYGGGEFTPDGKGVAIDSPATRTAMQFAKDLLPFQDPAVLSWGDVDNNTCLQSKRCSWIYNPISAYRTIETQDPELFKNVFVNLPLAGPKDQICSIQWECYGIWNFSKNVDAARQFLIDYIPEFQGQATASKGYNNPFLKSRLTKPMPVLGTDPKLSTLQDIANYVRAIGYPAPSTKAAFDSLNTHIITDLFTNYATGRKSLDESIADATKRLQASIAKFP
jgi:multiple sugar transport system substrate-binding protein